MPIAIPLVGEVSALTALLILLAALFLTEMLVRFLVAMHIDLIPFIGKALIDGVGGLAGIISNAAGWLWQHANPINLILGLGLWLGNFALSVINGVGQSAYLAIQRLLTVSIPMAVGAAESYAWGMVQSVYSTIAADVGALTTFAQALFHTAMLTIAADVLAVENYALGLYHAAVAITNAAVSAAEKWVAGEIGTLEVWVGAKIGQAIDYVNQEIGALRTWTNGELNSLRDYINTTLLARIAAVAAVATAVATDWFKWKKDCGEPLCSNLGNFGNEIAAIENAHGDVAIIALLAAAVADPQGVVNEVVSLLEGPVRGVTDTVTSVTGLPRVA